MIDKVFLVHGGGHGVDGRWLYGTCNGSCVPVLVWSVEGFGAKMNPTSRLPENIGKILFLSFLILRLNVATLFLKMEECADGGEEGRRPVQKKHVVVVMGSTGVGKSQLAIDLALALQKQQQGRVASISGYSRSDMVIHDDTHAV